jgi:hypothetical protein
MEESMKPMNQEILISPYSACKLCRYNLSDVCQQCLQDDQFPWFEPRKNLQLPELPLITSSEFNDSPFKMRQIVVGIYMEIIVRTLQGLA